MDALHYFLLVNFYLVLFYAFYALFLKNETFFKLNRFYLVGGAAMSFLIPFLQSDWIRSLFITKRVEEVTQNITLVFGGPELVIQAEETSWRASEILLSVYLAGAAFFLLRFIWQLYKVQAILKSGEAGQALSFFHKVKVDTEVPNRDTVLDHEMVHARQWHSADVILFEIITIVNWFNPVVYLYRNAIKHIHEFTADEIAATNEESKTAYAMLLVSKTFGIPTHQLTNSFYNQSLLKRRIIMLHKSKSTRNALLKYGLSAPLFAAMMILSSASFKSEKVAETFKDVSTDALDLIQTNDTIESDYEKFLKRNPNVQGLEWRTFTQVFVVLKNGKKQSYELSNAADVKKAEGLYGQFPSPPPPPPPIMEAIDVVSAVDEPGAHFSTVDQMPEFPGGMKAFYEFISKNFKYPDAARKENIAGKMIMNFVVESDGTLSDIKVLRTLGSGLDEEAVRLLKASPKWNPGVQKGKAVRVQYTLPISVSPPTQKTGSTIDRIEDGMLVSDIPENALFILDGKEVKREEFNRIDIKTSKLVNVLKGEAGFNKYGQKGKDGVVEIYVHNTPPNTAERAEIGTTGLTIKDSKLETTDFKGLAVLDGDEITTTTLKNLDPKTIQSMNVLKGEAAVKKYGSKAKEGAIEITSF